MNFRGVEAADEETEAVVSPARGAGRFLLPGGEEPSPSPSAADELLDVVVETTEKKRFIPPLIRYSRVVCCLLCAALGVVAT